MNKKTQLSDDYLVTQYQQGNQKVIAKLVRRWHKIFCNKAYWLLKDSELAKDVAQDSWDTIIANLNGLKDPKSFASWSSRIVYNKSIDLLNKQNRERNKREEYLKDNDHAKQEGSTNSLKTSLLKAINNLPIKQQNGIQLFYVENYSLKEISEIQKVSIGTVKSRLFKARENLKTLLKKEKI